MNDLYAKALTCNFEKLFSKKGFVFFTKGAYNLNIIGIRHKGKKITNVFDDIIVVIYNTPDGNRVRRVYYVTTQPGITSMRNTNNKKGCAILVPGQYRSCWKIGLHRGKYAALVQSKPVKVYRDANKNDIYDYEPSTIDKGVFGINIHKAGANSTHVDNWSAGCQVFRLENQFKAFMRLCREQVINGLGNSFTYTLIEEEDLP